MFAVLFTSLAGSSEGGCERLTSTEGFSPMLVVPKFGCRRMYQNVLYDTFSETRTPRRMDSVFSSVDVGTFLAAAMTPATCWTRIEPDLL